MSKYTTQLRWIVEQLGSGLDVPSGQEYADAVYKYIGLDKYPIFNEEYRKRLNDKIINHFYFREIGFETAAQFAWYLRRTMNEIMPKYNRLYDVLETEFDHPLSDWTRHRVTDIDDTNYSKSDSENESQTDTVRNGTTDTDTHNRTVFSDTPMSMLNNTGEPQIANLDYATTVTYEDGNVHTESTENTTSNTDSNGSVITNGTATRDKIEDEYGRNHSLGYLIEEFNDKFVDIDLMIIKDLEPLFFGLW